MQPGTDLTAHCPPRQGDLAESGRVRLLRNLGRWSPFVFPWSGLQCMTGVVVTSTGVTLAHGRLDGRRFHVEEVVHRPGPDVAGCLENLGHRYEGPACVSLPRSKTLIRHFRVPAETRTEIDAMLPHLLASELPMSLEHFSWVWAPLPTREEGFTLVTVFVARNDQLEEFLAPLTQVGLNVVNLVPAGWSWAHVIARVGGVGAEGDDPVDHHFVVQSDGVPYLVVERDGQLLFDMELAASACRTPRDLTRVGVAATRALDWDGPGFAEAREAFAELLGFPLPRPQIWTDSPRTATAVGRDQHYFAASVAATGLSREQTLLPPLQRQRTRRHTILDAVAGLIRLGILAVLLWLALALYENHQTRQYLATLERQLEEQAPRVAVLEMEYGAIRENNRERASSTEILQALASLRHHVEPPVYLEQLNYVQGRGITLRGRASANATVLEMADRLATDPLWHSLRVVQLRSERLDGVDQVHFVVEGRLN